MGYIIVIAQVLGDQGFMAVVNKTCSRATPSDSVCLLPKIPGTVAITVT